MLFIILFSITSVSASNENNTFSDIQNIVDVSNENDTINLNGVYKSNGKSIEVTKSLTFNGNATLDANHISGIFNITKDSTLTFNNVNFINSKNSAILTHITDTFSQTRSKVILNNCNFINNYGIEGAVYVYECNINNSNFINNHALGYVDDQSSWGGAVQSFYCSVMNSNFTNNSAFTNGGAILSENGLISKCNFINNSAGWEGGAFEIADFSAVDCNFTNNYASRYGGAIYADSGDIINCRFNNNTSNNTGGAVKSYKINAYNSIFTNNTAIYAGAIYTSNLKLDNTKFINNHEAAVISKSTTIDFKTTYNNFVSLDNSLNPFNLITVNAKSLKTSYQSGEKLKITFTTSENNKAASYFDSLIIIKKGKKTIYDYATCDDKGVYEVSVSKLSAGTYEFQIVSEDSDEYFTAPFEEKKVTVTITKAKTIVKAPKVSNKYKKSKYFKVSVKHKETKKALKNIKIKLKIYTGKKSKIYTVKTDKSGNAKFKTNKLKRGNHKVIISSGNNNIIISKKSNIKIK